MIPLSTPVTHKLTGEEMTVVRNQNAPVYTLKKKPETLKLMGMEVVNDLAVCHEDNLLILLPPAQNP